MMISQVNTPPPSEVADLTSSALQNAGDKAKLLQLLAPVQQASEGLKKVNRPIGTRPAVFPVAPIGCRSGVPIGRRLTPCSWSADFSIGNGRAFDGTGSGS